MLTTGIDLAAQPDETGACTVSWDNDVLQVVIHKPCNDLSLSKLLDRATTQGPEQHWVAIDAPFGWPAGFAAEVEAWTRGGRWGTSYAHGARLLRHRQTDRELAKNLPGVTAPPSPLAVSAERLGAAAMRCAYLLSEWCESEGIASPHEPGLPIVECYPAAALARWGLAHKGYKGNKLQHRERREVVASELQAGLGVTVEGLDLLASDHLIDAFIAALVARAVACGLAVDRPELEYPHEGWIELPAEQCRLADLVAGSFPVDQ